MEERSAEGLFDKLFNFLRSGGRKSMNYITAGTARM